MSVGFAIALVGYGMLLSGPEVYADAGAAVV